MSWRPQNLENLSKNMMLQTESDLLVQFCYLYCHESF